MQEQDGDSEPAHHARRPMNAFLIFCKRHRSVVRDKYPNLENRSITKILGEWWANLDKEEKACYTGLAKQYKDAFFSANPDFKWYKLPAPPLRTLASRPRDLDRPAPPPDTYHDHDLEKTNNNSTKVDFNKKPNHAFDEPKPVLSMFTPGKLADEAQMGGLSRLLDAAIESSNPNPYYSPSPLKFSAISSEYRSHNIIDRGVSRDDNIRELQNALTETTRVFEEEFDENKARLYRNVGPGDMFTHQHVIDQVVDKQYSKDDEYGYPRAWLDDDKSRTGRSCKGKRYQEFMAVGGLMANKRQRRDYRDKTPDDAYNTTASAVWDPSVRSEESSLAEQPPPAAAPAPPERPDPPDVSVTTDAPDTIDAPDVPKAPDAPNAPDAPDATDAADHDAAANKTFKAADFDLDAKIAALPSLSLEKFQQKKRENKRRKKTINLKPKVLGSSYIANSVPDYDRREAAESWREAMIGSQKRKPRKVSITRFEISSLVASVEMNERRVSPEMKIATEAPPPPADDLLALATLAEVAANTSRIAATPAAPAAPAAPAPPADDSSAV